MAPCVKHSRATNGHNVLIPFIKCIFGIYELIGSTGNYCELPVRSILEPDIAFGLFAGFFCGGKTMPVSLATQQFCVEMAAQIPKAEV